MDDINPVPTAPGNDLEGGNFRQPLLLTESRGSWQGSF